MCQLTNIPKPPKPCFMGSSEFFLGFVKPVANNQSNDFVTCCNVMYKYTDGATFYLQQGLFLKFPSLDSTGDILKKNKKQHMEKRLEPI